jgi:hypothetical protein
VFLGWRGKSVARAEAQATVYVPRVRKARAAVLGGESFLQKDHWKLGKSVVLAVGLGRPSL